VKRRTKILLAALALCLVLPVVGYVALMATLHRALSGSWPFTPLERIENRIDLPNGSFVQIEAIEQRGFRSDGWSVYATYFPAAESAGEVIGFWEGYNHRPPVYVVDRLVVLPSPDQRTLYVRTPANEWKFFYLNFPDEQPGLPISHYTALTTLTEEEMASIRKDMTPEERAYSPSASLESFDPATRKVHITYRTTSARTRELVLQLSEDGTDLTLSSIRLIEARGGAEAGGTAPVP
jgi:hypothetical protein